MLLSMAFRSSAKEFSTYAKESATSKDSKLAKKDD
jgi:hypothetical protein